MWLPFAFAYGGDVGHPLMCLFPFVLSGEMSVQIFCQFINWVIFLFIIEI